MVTTLGKQLTRHQAREKVVQTLFQLIRPDIQCSVAEALAFSYDAGNDPEPGFDGRDVFVERLVNGVYEMTDILNAEISRYLQSGWSIERIAKIDLAILQLAFYEILYTSNEEIPVIVSVNEAVELAKAFSDDKSKTFVHGVLAKLVADMEQA